MSAVIKNVDTSNGLYGCPRRPTSLNDVDLHLHRTCLRAQLYVLIRSDCEDDGGTN